MAETPQQLRVFVSHSHQDNAFCHAIVAALRDAGADVWYDEHNLGWGELHEVIQRELGRRAIFVLILSKHAFTSPWVKRETGWAYKLYSREHTRVILPVTAGRIEATDFDPEIGWLFLDDFKRIEAPGYLPFPSDEAANRLIRALGLTPAGESPTPVVPQPTENMDDLLIRGNALVAQGKYTAALPLFERATHLAPGSFEVWANLGLVLSGMRRNQEALGALDRALALNDGQAWVWVNKGVALGSLHRFQEALGTCDRALALDPNNAIAWTNKGVALGHLGRHEEALDACDRALAFDPDFATAWANKGIVLFNLGRSEAAVDAFERALVLDPNDAATWTRKGDAMRRLRWYEAAVDAYDQALALDPNQATTWASKGGALSYLGGMERSLAAYDRALTLDPNYALAWHSRSLALRRMGHNAEAKIAELHAKELGWLE